MLTRLSLEVGQQPKGTFREFHWRSQKLNWSYRTSRAQEFSKFPPRNAQSFRSKSYFLGRVFGSNPMREDAAALEERGRNKKKRKKCPLGTFSFLISLRHSRLSSPDWGSGDQLRLLPLCVSDGGGSDKARKGRGEKKFLWSID